MDLSSKGMSIGWMWWVAIIRHLVCWPHSKTPILACNNVPLPMLCGIIQDELSAFGTKQKVILSRHLPRFLVFGIMNPGRMIYCTDDNLALDGIGVGTRVALQNPISEGRGHTQTKYPHSHAVPHPHP